MHTKTLNMALRRTLCLLALVCSTFIIYARVADDAATNFTLVIDAGHGGHDSGAVGSFSKEKNINLNVALELGRLVKENCPDVKVIYTRKTDVFIPLQERAEIANRNKADLFVSIHTNALPGGKIAYGSETYTMGMARAASNLEVAKRENAVITYEKDYKEKYAGFDPNKAESYIIFEYIQDRYMKQSVELARCIQKQYVRHGRKDKGVHQAGFLVLRETTMPAVLTELGFISTPEEETYLNSDEGIKALARSIYNGFCVYRGQTPVAEAPVAPQPVEEPEPKVLAQAETPAPAAKPEQREAPAPKAAAPKAAKPCQSKQPAEEAKQPVQEVKQPVQEAKQSVQEVKPQVKEDKQSVQEVKPKVKEDKQSAETGKPVFKIQIMTSDKRLRADDPRFKGLKGVENYTEGNVVKYTYGATTDYNEIRSLQATIKDKFEGTFIVAFEDGKRTDLQQAIKKSRK